jgi:hypothetical protein
MASQAGVPLLHRLLGIGLVTLAAVFGGLTYAGVAPLLGRDEGSHVIAYAMAGISLAVCAIALLFFKPRVPERSAGQSVEQYWSARDVTEKILLVWFLLEGAAILAGIGYLLTGELATMIVAGAAIVVFWVCGPRAFAEG